MCITSLLACWVQRLLARPGIMLYTGGQASRATARPAPLFRLKCKQVCTSCACYMPLGDDITAGNLKQPQVSPGGFFSTVKDVNMHIGGPRDTASCCG